ncbi:hypothetical protein GALMADRAFT_1354941, partial [Galerina marginata CBS 339.88]
RHRTLFRWSNTSCPTVDLTSLIALLYCQWNLGPMVFSFFPPYRSKAWMAKFISKVFAILRKRPNTDREANWEGNWHLEATSGHIGHNYQNVNSIHRLLLTPTIGLAPNHADPLSEQLGLCPILETREPPPDDSGGHENVTQRRMERLEEMIGVLVQAQYRPRMPPINSVDFIFVMDATGGKHPLTMNMAGSLEAIFSVFEIFIRLAKSPSNFITLFGCMDFGTYVLSIEDGAEGIQLFSPDISNVFQHGPSVVMNIVMRQEFAEREYKFPFCYNWNALRGQSSIDCCSCKQRFKVTRAGKIIAKLQTSYQERNLIRNLHLEQYQDHDLYCSPKCEGYDSPPSPLNYNYMGTSHHSQWTGNDSAGILARAAKLSSGAPEEEPCDDRSPFPFLSGGIFCQPPPKLLKSHPRPIHLNSCAILFSEPFTQH